MLLCLFPGAVQPALRSGALDTIKKRRIVMNGPLKLVQGNFGTISRIPIFIEDVPANDAFGNNITGGLGGRACAAVCSIRLCPSA